MSICKVAAVLLCLELLSLGASAQSNAAASATAKSVPSPTPTPTTSGSTAFASAIATALSSGNAQAAATAIAAAQSAGQTTAYATAFAQVSLRKAADDLFNAVSLFIRAHNRLRFRQSLLVLHHRQWLKLLLLPDRPTARQRQQQLLLPRAPMDLLPHLHHLPRQLRLLLRLPHVETQVLQLKRWQGHQVCCFGESLCLDFTLVQ